MTDIHTPDPDDVTTAVGVLQHVDPKVLEMGDNVREFANLTKPFLSSIAEHGVLVPLTAVQRPDGAIEVRNGQRRTAAARELGLTTVPVYVLPASAADSGTEVIDRIVHQLVTNDHKADLSDAQRARGIQQMIDAGLSVTKVAKKLAVTKDTVKAAEAAAGSATALEALEVGQLSLVEAAALTEVDDDPDAVARLLEVAGTPRFDHVLAQIKADRTSAEARAQEAARYTAQGFAVLDDRPYGWHMDCIPARDVWVTGADGEPTEADPATSTAPQAWAVWLDEYVEYADRDSGEVVEEDAVDWDTEGDPGAVPGDGLRHADTVVERTAFEPNWYCLDPEAAGMQVLESFVRNAQWAANRQHANENPIAPVELDSEATDADREAAAARAAAERAEADKRERRKVVTLNKLGAAAIGVRRAFVTALVARKTPPKGSAQFIASCLARDSFMLTHHQVDDVAAELLGVQGGRDGLRTLIDGLPANGEGRAQVITLALVLAALEVKTTKEAWRSPAPLVDDSENASHHNRLGGVSTGDYLRWLAGHEYALSEVEQVVTGQRSADEVFDGLTAPQ